MPDLKKHILQKATSYCTFGSKVYNFDGIKKFRRDVNLKKRISLFAHSGDLSRCRSAMLQFEFKALQYNCFVVYFTVHS